VVKALYRKKVTIVEKKILFTLSRTFLLQEKKGFLNEAKSFVFMLLQYVDKKDKRCVEREGICFIHNVLPATQNGKKLSIHRTRQPAPLARQTICCLIVHVLQVTQNGKKLSYHKKGQKLTDI
jgi:hypothetical protein